MCMCAGVCVACMHACVYVFVVWVVCVHGWCVGMGVCVGVVCALSLRASVSELVCLQCHVCIHV